MQLLYRLAGSTTMLILLWITFIAITLQTGAKVSAENDNSATGQYIYTIDGERNAVYQFKVGPNGVLVPFAQTALATGNGPIAIAAALHGRSVYVANYSSSSISQYILGSDGSLAYENPMAISTAGPPVALVIEPTGHFLYVVCQAQDNVSKANVAQYRISNNGTLTPLLPDQVILKHQPNSITTDVLGHYVFVSYRNEANIDRFEIGPDGVSVKPEIGCNYYFPCSFFGGCL